MAPIQYFIQHRLWCEQTSSRSVLDALAPENLTFGLASREMMAGLFHSHIIAREVLILTLLIEIAQYY